MVIITHQMSVVQSICDKVAIIDHGEIVERGKVSEIFRKIQKSEAAKRFSISRETGSYCGFGKLGDNRSFI